MTTSTTTTARPFRWSWAWTPFVVIGAAAIANTVMIVTSTRVRPQQVAANAYLDSKSFDARKAAQARFVEQGFDLTVSIHPGSATLTLTGAAVSTADNTKSDPLTIRAYRADDASLDASVLWSDPTKPITVQLAPGRWRLDVNSDRGDKAVAVTRPVSIPGE